MFEIIDHIAQILPVYLLVFARMSALALTLPVFGYSAVNVRIRITIAAAFTLIVAPVLVKNDLVTYTSTLVLAFDIGREVLIGLILGFGTRVIFEAISMAGAIAGMQMGVAMMNAFDPMSQEQQPIISNFWVLLVLILFLITNSHYYFIELMVQNYKMIPIASARFQPILGQTIVHGGGIIFELAIKFAAPAIAFLLITDVALGYMARIMPNLNIFFIMLPMKIALGIFILITSLKIFQTLYLYMYNEMVTLVYTMVKGF
jgi:flagellar biosynthetic protein FliR